MIPVSVCLSVTRLTVLHCSKMAERINMLFGVNTRRGPRNIVLDGGPDSPQSGAGDSMQPSPNYFGLLLLSIYDQSVLCERDSESVAVLLSSRQF